MVTIIARFTMQEGKEEKALEELRKMAEAVQANEPGTLAYLFLRSPDNLSEIIFFESYADDAAFQAHMQTPHMGAFRSAFGEAFDGSKTKFERLERVSGFSRAMG